MKTGSQKITQVLLLVATIALIFIAYALISGQSSVVSQGKAQVDYTNFVVILLTTVTVIFTVCALALAVLGVIGFRGLKKEAGRFASEKATNEVTLALAEGGRVHQLIEVELGKPDGQLIKLVERRIRSEVIDLLPLVIKGQGQRLVASDEPTDEGDVE